MNINDDRLKETVRVGRERGETLKDALGAAWRGAAEEWRSAAEERAFEEGRPSAERSTEGVRERWSNAGWTTTPRYYIPRKYPPHVLAAYHRLGLSAGSSLVEVNKKRRELVKRYHPDRFVDSEQRARAEKLTAKINAAHDVVERHLTSEK